MSIKLTDTQLVLLGAAAQRKDLCLVAPPTLKGATAQKVASKLISAGFVKEVKAKTSDPIWRRRLASSDLHPFEARIATTREGTKLKAGALLAREWNGRLERVMILDKGVAWNGETYGSLSQVAKAMTGTSWNGHRFFGLRTAGSDRSGMVPRRSRVCETASPMPPRHRSKTAEPLSPDDLAGGRRRYEIGERQNDAALRNLHPRFDRAWPGAGV